MANEKPGSDPARANQIKQQTSPGKARREAEYRDKALKLYPWVCGRCGREFKYSGLSELTDHHKDHNHDNNPADGSNWELLCVYCHDNEHSRYVDTAQYSRTVPGEDDHESATSQPFAKLRQLLKDQE